MLHILFDGIIKNAVRTGDTADEALHRQKQAAFYAAGNGNPNHIAEWQRRQAATENGTDNG